MTRVALLISISAAAAQNFPSIPSNIVGFVVTASDNATCSGERALRGHTVLSGDSLNVADGAAEISLMNGSKIILGHDTQLRLERHQNEVTALLGRGGVDLYTSKNGRTFRVRAGNVSILPNAGLNTQTEVAITAEALIIAAREGSVLVEGNGQPLNVLKGKAVKFLPDPSAPGGTGSQAQAPLGGVPVRIWGRVFWCTVVGAAVGSIPLLVTELQSASPDITLGWWIAGGGAGGGLICWVIHPPPPPPPGQPPPSCTLVSNPVKVIGALPTLSWTSQNATTLAIQPGVGPVAPPAGTTPATPPKVGTTTYTMTATGPGGVANCTADITVSGPRCTLTASPAKVYLGDDVKLSWIALATIGQVSIQPGVGQQPATGVLNVKPAAEGKVTYTLTANGFGGTSTTCNASVDVGPKCAIPTNFRQTAVAPLGDGTNNPRLRFTYRWDSSSGNLADLANCTVGERVSYPGAATPYNFPAPMTSSVPNPTVINLPGRNGTFIDTHSNSGFAAPYKAANFTATQVYRYRCVCSDGTVRTGDLMGPIDIDRAVTRNADGTYTYTVTKSGSSAEGPLP